MVCVSCQRAEAVCGPLKAGMCLECEMTLADLRDLETLRLLQEHGYEAAAERPAESAAGGCRECGGMEWLEDAGLKMCMNCGTIQ